MGVEEVCYQHRGGDEPPLKIRVVNAKRASLDVTVIAPEELRTILETLVSEFDPDEREAVFAFEQIASNVRALGDTCPAGSEALFEGPLVPLDVSRRIEAGIMDEVALRQLLYSEAIIPVLAPAGADVAPGQIRIRPGVRKPALAPNTPGRGQPPYRDAAIAAEQPIVVEGLNVNLQNQGESIIRVFAGDVYHGLQALINSGAFSAPVLSVVLSWHGPRPSPPAEILAYTPALVLSLRRELGGALAFHLSGAGVYLALTEALRLAQKNPNKPGGILGETIVRPPSYGLVTPPGSTLRHFIARLVEVFAGASITAAPEGFVFMLTSLLDIYRVGALGAYYYALSEGVDSPGVRRFLERVAVARGEEAQLAILNTAVFIDIAKARHYAIIIEEKFGAKKLQEIFDTLLRSEKTGLDNPQALLNQLGGRAREIVITEYDNRKAEWAAQVNNQCPHVRLTFRLRSTVSAQGAVEILQELSAYFQPANPKLRWILCKKCGFRVICPHVDELIRMNALNLPYDTISTRLMKYSVQYSDARESEGESRTTYYYFCRICSERLGEAIKEDRTAEILGAVGGLDNHIKKIIWAEAMNAAQLVLFPMPVDPRQFAATAVDVCYSLILLAEEALLRRGRRGGYTDPFNEEEDAIDPRTRLYIAIFVYAYVLNLIRSSNEASKIPGQRLGFENVNPNAKMAIYAETILTTILRKHAGLIGQIEDISPEFIASRFREAYRLVVGEKGSQELATADVAKDIVMRIVTLSPIYHYIAIAARVFGLVPIGRASTPEAARREFEVVYGRSLPDILDDKTIDQKSRHLQIMLGLRPTARGSRRVVVEYPRGSDPFYIYGVPEVNLLHKMMRVPEAFARSVDTAPLIAAEKLAAARPALLHYNVTEAIGGAGKKRQEPLSLLRADPILAKLQSGLFLDTYRLFTEYSVEVVDATTMATYMAHLAEARHRERGYLLYLAATSVKNHHYFGFTASRRFGFYDRGGQPLTVVAPLTYLYDEDGLRHSWVSGKANIYVYSSGLEISGGDLIKAIEERRKNGSAENPIHGLTLLDIRCSVCKTLRSEAGTLDPRKAAESLKAIASFDAFFAFYASRCPAGDLHDFSEKTCVKCGLVEALVFGYKASAHTAAARAYYDKYLEIFREQRAAAGSTLEAFHTVRFDTDPAREKYQAFAADWEPDYTFIVQAAELAEVPVVALETFGATEGRVYSDVLSGVGAPPLPTSLDDPRVTAADADVRVFITSYNRLRFAHRFLNLPPEVVVFLEEAQISRPTFETLSAELPDIFDDYYLKRQALIEHRPPNDILLFSLETLARMVLTVANKGGVLGKTFARRELRDIIRSERLLAKNGPFSFKIFGDGGDVGGGTLDGIINEFDDDQDGADVDDDDRGGDDPFSLEEVDIEEDNPNLEPN